MKKAVARVSEETQAGRNLNVEVEKVMKLVLISMKGTMLYFQAVISISVNVFFQTRIFKCEDFLN